MAADKLETGDKGPIENRKYARLTAPPSDSSIVTIEHNNTTLTKCKLANFSTGGAAVIVQQHNDLYVGSKIDEITIEFADGRKVFSPAIVRHIARVEGTEWNRYGIEVNRWKH